MKPGAVHTALPANRSLIGRQSPSSRSSNDRDFGPWNAELSSEWMMTLTVEGYERLIPHDRGERSRRHFASKRHFSSRRTRSTSEKR